jgi:hypothetical protein
MKIKSAILLSMLAFFLLAPCLSVFALTVEVDNDTDRSRKVYLHAKKVVRLGQFQEEITLDFMERTILTKCVGRFDLSAPSSSVYLLIEDGNNQFIKHTISQTGRYFVSSILEEKLRDLSAYDW